MQATLQTSNSQILVSALAKVKFSATQANGSTDAGKVKDKLFLVLYFDPHAKDGKVPVRDTILTVREPKSGIPRVCLSVLRIHLPLLVYQTGRKILALGVMALVWTYIAAGGLRSCLEKVKVLLEKAKFDCSLLKEDDMVDYARRYLNLVQEEYRVMCWKLFNTIKREQHSVFGRTISLSPHC